MSLRLQLVTALLGSVLLVSACGGDEPPEITAGPGELIAYTAGDGIHVVTPDGRHDWRIPVAGDLSGPRWSPDGSRFAAVDLRDCCKVYSVSIHGFEKQQLPASSSTTPDWSPDGTRLAVFDEEDVRIHVVRVADGRSEAEIPKSGNEPAWSPDGRTIAFQGSDGLFGELRIFLASPAGGDARRLTELAEGDEGEHGAAWSPDGRRLAFASDEDGDDEIYVARLDGTGLRQVTANRIDDSNPSWSPDGARIVFDRTWPDRTAIVVLDLDTGAETTVATGGLDGGDLVFEPSWQPARASG